MEEVLKNPGLTKNIIDFHRSKKSGESAVQLILYSEPGLSLDIFFVFYPSHLGHFCQSVGESLRQSIDYFLPGWTDWSRSSKDHKLPNPLTPLLQRLPTVDGLDTEDLLRFLSEILRLHDLPGLQGASFLHVISPFCRPPLGDCLVRVLQRGGTLDDFHREALDFFVPGPLRERLRVEKFFRPQGNGESLAKFVAEVRDTDRVLRLDIPESTVVTTILEGLNPEERSRLVYAGRPSTFSELDRLCIASRSVQFADRFDSGFDQTLNYKYKLIK
ncbi:hypothetical protein J6590_082531 [Homalodisca vitripennis]|nr:hypothetical protein J6590_082531 [Homalodisca vitripennis]